MKNAVILHGTENTHEGNWFPWLTAELKKNGYEVFSPDLPHAERPNIQRYTEFLLPRWQYNRDTILVGHSSGAVGALGLLQALPDHTLIKCVYLVSCFTDNLGNPESELFLKPLDYDRIRTKSDKFFIFHSDNDPYVPLWHAERLRDLLHADLQVIPGEGHFNVEKSEQYRQFPLLRSTILNNQ